MPPTTRRRVLDQAGLARRLAVILTLAALSGCATPEGSGDVGGTPPSPAPISHVVLFDLLDSADAPALIADSRDTLSRIPEVVSLACGRHLETGRATVLSDYDVGLYVGFATPEDYAAYLIHPEHVALVDRWKSRSGGLRVVDFLDERGTRSE